MATWPAKTDYATGDVLSATNMNDIGNGLNDLYGESFTNNFYAGKNKIINGDMAIWQRGTGSATPANGAYTNCDRWIHTGNSTTVTRSTDVPTAIYTPYSISLAGSDPTFGQRIESLNSTKLAGQTVTISFYAKSTAGTTALILAVYYPNATDNFSANTQIGSTQTISASPSSSWTRYTYTVALPSNVTNGLQILVGRASGSSSTTLYTGFQVEVGSTATNFQTATGTIQGELAACQRYYLSWVSGNTLSIGVGFETSVSTIGTVVNFPVTMRTTPSLVASSGTNYYRFERNATSDDFNSLTIWNATPQSTGMYNNTDISGTAGWAGFIYTNNASASVAFNAEL